MPWGVLTFEPHPRAYFNKGAPPFRLTPFHLKARYIQEMGVDFLVVLKFDYNLASMSAEDFVGTILVDGFRVKLVVSGGDFVFGNQRRGTMAYLRTKGKQHDFQSVSVPQVIDGAGQIISSTRVREFLVSAKPLEAARLLGRGFEIEGRVITGDQRGRAIGFPTANLETNRDMAIPGNGIYATRISVGNENHLSATSIGTNPTFHENIHSILSRLESRIIWVRGLSGFLSYSGQIHTV